MMKIRVFQLLFLIAVMIPKHSLAQNFSEEASSKKINDYFGNIELIKKKALPNPEELKEIIRAGVDLNYPGKSGAPSTLYRLHNIGLVYSGQSREQTDIFMTNIFKILLEGGLKVNDTCNENTYAAIINGMTKYLDALIGSGCDLVTMQINIGSDNYPKRIDPIDLAEKFGQDDLVEIFLKYGAKRKSLPIRAQLRLTGGAALNSQAQVIKAIRDGANINLPDIFGDYALKEIITNGDLSDEKINTLALMLKLGVLPNRKIDGEDPLFIAVQEFSRQCQILECDGYDLKIVQMLIDAGALVSAKSGWVNRTPLHIASKENYYDMAKILVDSGAKVMILDETGKTPIDLTESGEIIKLLKENGAMERGY